MRNIKIDSQFPPLNRKITAKTKNYFKWDFLSLLVLLSILVLQITRWRILPQFMDIYYHIHTAWGFIQAGGYSGWDFWQYAPAGRIHIYPPIFHIILALLIEAGFNKLILAKIFQTVLPPAVLFSIWFFARRNFGKSLAFFVAISSLTSYSFYVNLIERPIGAFSIILGILSLDQLLNKRYTRSIFLLTLSFYTHIGIPWLFALSVILYALFNRDLREKCIKIVVFALFFSMPIIIHQIQGINAISRIGMNLTETINAQYKILEYMFALFGLIISFKLERKYRIFPSLFFASLIFLSYPYRFFSAEGYLCIIFLCGVFLNYFYLKLNLKKRKLKVAIVSLVFFYCLFVSPSVISNFDIELDLKKIKPRFLLGHTAFRGMIFPEDKNRGFYNYIWFARKPKMYLSMAELIKNNSHEDDIIFCSINSIGVCLASFADRATTNGLFREIGPSSSFDPFVVSKIIVFTKFPKIDDPVLVNEIVSGYKLVKLGENEEYIFYNNPSCKTRMRVKKALLPFWVIVLIGLAAPLFLLRKNPEGKHF